MLKSACLLSCMSLLPAVSFSAPPPPLKPEVSDVATLPISIPHRFFTVSFSQSVVIYDADSGKVEGEVPAFRDSNLALAPDNSKIYVAETTFAHGNRGKRIDLLSIYDTKTLNLTKEVELPGRALVALKNRNLEVNASGKRAYIYNLHPASSMLWVNLQTQTLGGSVEIPGCALAFPWGEQGVSSLCGDGSLATVTVPDSGAPTITHSKPFFDASKDPIYDNSLIDHNTDTAVMLSYTGLIYQVKLGVEPVIEKPWSIQEAAGQKAAGTGVDELAWRPGGAQPIAWHKDSGRLFVLMHPGNYWSHQMGGTEIWVLGLKTHTLLGRYMAPKFADGAPGNIAVSQKAKPQLYLLSGSGDVVLDADTGEEIRKIDTGKGDIAVVPGS